MPYAPLPEWDEFKGVRPLKSTLVRRVELYTEQKEITAALNEINKPLFEKLHRALPDGVKSINFNEHQITPIQGEPRKRFDRETMLNSTFSCPHCRKQVTVPIKVLDKAYKAGELPKPTVMVRPVKVRGGDGDNEDEE